MYKKIFDKQEQCSIQSLMEKSKLISTVAAERKSKIGRLHIKRMMTK